MLFLSLLTQQILGGGFWRKASQMTNRDFGSYTWLVFWLSAAAAAAAKLLQSCPTLCDPLDGSPLGSPVPGILQARTLEWIAISFSNAWKWKVKVNSLSRVRLFVTPWTAAHQAPPSMGFSRQEYWSGVPLPSPHSTLPSGNKQSLTGSIAFVMMFLPLKNTISCSQPRSLLIGCSYPRTFSQPLETVFLRLPTVIDQIFWFFIFLIFSSPQTNTFIMPN